MLKVEWILNAITEIANAENKDQCCFIRTVLWTLVSSREGLVGWVDAALISKIGDVPARISRGRAITVGLFWLGALDAFQICAISPVTASTVKTNATSLDWTMNCSEVNWKCQEND
jgi:hypothetical protein